MSNYKKIILVTALVVLVVCAGVGYVFADMPTVSFEGSTTPAGTIYSVADENTLSIEVELVTTGDGERYSFVDFGNDLAIWLRGENFSDGSSYGRDATAIGDSTSVAGGKFGNKLDFDGSGDYLRLSTDIDPELGGDYSLSFWFNVDNFTPGDYTRLSWYDYGWLIITYRNANGDFWIDTSEGDHYTDVVNLSADTWYHLVITAQTGGEINTYLNGAVIGSEAFGDFDNSSSEIRFPNNDFDGALDELLVFRRILTQEEIDSLYDSSDYGSPYGGAFSNGMVTYDTSITFKAYVADTQGDDFVSRTTTYVYGSSQTVTTDAASSVTKTTATLNGTIHGDGGLDATESGFAYGTSSNLSTVIATTTEGAQVSTVSFTSDITSLTCGTTYYVRAYTTNPAGTAYGTIETFDTSSCIVAPTVTTDTATSITSSGATLNGTISSAGGENATARGFNYGLTNSYGSTASASGSYAAGGFTEAVTGLACDTTYHYNFFATNSAGTTNGSDATFTTSGCPSSGSTARSTSPTTPTTPSNPIPPITPENNSLIQVLTNQLITLLQVLKAEAEKLGLNTDNLNIPNPSPETPEDFTFTQDLWSGMENNDVKQLQIWLNTHGFTIATSGPGSPGNETSYFGLSTTNQVRLLQQSIGVPATGVFGPRTRAYVNANLN